MAKVKVKLDRAAVRDQLLKSPEMAAICQELAEAAVLRLGNGYSANTYQGKNRVNVEISADSPEARRENMENNTILKALRT